MNSRFSKIVQNPSFAPVITGLIGLGVGAGVGYILGKRTVPTVIENGPLQMEFQYVDPNGKSDDSFEGSEDVEPELGLPVQTLDLGERFVSRKVIDEAPPISVDDPIVHNMILRMRFLVAQKHFRIFFIRMSFTQTNLGMSRLL